MKLEHRHNELLVKFLLNETSAEETQNVLDWINTSQNNRVYLQSLFNTLKLMHIKKETDKINVSMEWQQFQQIKLANKPIDFERINEEAPNAEEALPERSVVNKSRIYKRIIIGAIAASLIFAILLTGNLFKSNKNIDHGRTSDSKRTDAKANSLIALKVYEQNTTSKVQKIILPDKSEVLLFQKSALTYTEPANKNKREVMVEGKADFKVAKDKSRPFTVFTGDISTTCLGTQFTVIANPLAKEIYVLLHEGKVVVKSTKAARTMKDIYLVPGQELIYNVVTQTAAVRSFSLFPKVRKPSASRELVMDNPIAPKYGKKAWFMFNNQPLKEIFDVLTTMYDVKISYSQKDIEGSYFIGTFHKTDSIGKILREIAVVNNLSVIKAGNGYKIMRKDKTVK